MLKRLTLSKILFAKCLFVTGLWSGVFTSTPLKAQSQILVGYNLSYFPDHSANVHLQAFNAQNDWLKNPFPDARLQHGLQLGYLHGWERLSLGVYYKNGGFRVEAEGVPPNSNDSERRQIKFRSNVVGLSVSSNHPLLNYGSALEYNFHKISGVLSTLSNDFEIQKDRFWGAQIFLSIDLQGSRTIGLSIQPSYTFVLQSFSLDALANELSSGISNEYRSGYFGLTLLLRNGPRIR